MASKSPIVTWQGTHNELMKLITRTNVSCLDLDMHKSKDIITITHQSMVLTTNERMAC